MTPALTASASGQAGPGNTPLPLRAKVKNRQRIAAFAGTRSSHANAETGTGSVIELLPTEHDKKKSLTIGRYQFRSDGVGWECKETIGRGASRKRVYLKHLSRARYQKMQAASATQQELETKLLAWADRQRAEKRTG